MSVQDYIEEKQEYDRATRMVELTRENGNNLNMHHAELKNCYHYISFSFSNKHGTSHEYDSSEAFVEYIGKACEEIKYTIMNRALELYKIRLKEIAEGSREEVAMVLNELGEGLNES